MLYVALCLLLLLASISHMVLRTVLLLATSITIAAEALLLALPLAQALPLQRGSFTSIPPYIHNACYAHVPSYFMKQQRELLLQRERGLNRNTCI